MKDNEYIRKVVLPSRIIQLLDLIDISREDGTLKEILEEEEELKAILEVNDSMIGIDINSIGSLEHFIHRAWLFEYKGRGYVLIDESNGHYSYCLTAEDLICSLNISDDYFNKVL